ncbi:30S ribosomal protein S17 [Candidatus Uhrbacteria bacterium RIFCSPHIGHO2_12_FULL_54_23]|uniref:Small ribosomal subunit protein uS17 n=3 Tax=Candidatus Uhriibacteriota TaxID=1752732 RepID=A0A1F7UJR4_9BACT|nr:MAG: 30S ribosomal protein S17 [Candidatus Uhrbacteria bacterium RIFCSPHIGHO2_12_FULL_54_23]OGL83627.1 MAG: 30S ribosomal protein S17 [Candidatus Uhrbacteria bacterium RIFCSPLOWO2_01_FULL_55_36]OGL89998.1 MAG: 30S ribosomal protein S17 [Candidatus Uhrbacteria bacterium RIFCSPLOWO2_02_FULL_54_37]
MTHPRTFIGTVVSDRMQKTLVVNVDRVKVHPKYEKRYVASTTFKVHDEKGAYHTGDKVIFVECRPLSKDKRWKVIEKVQSPKSKVQNYGVPPSGT